MINIKISKLEKNLGRKVKCPTFCVGVDTAATTGVCILTLTGLGAHFEWELFKLPSIPRKIADQMVKAEKYEQTLDSMRGMIEEIKDKQKLENLKNSILVIEQSYMFNNPETFGILRAEQGIVYSVLGPEFEEVKIWLPTVVRKMVGFQSNLNRSAERKDKKQEIVNWVNKVLGAKLVDDNLADATILALAGVIK